MSSRERGPSLYLSSREGKTVADGVLAEDGSVFPSGKAGSAVPGSDHVWCGRMRWTLTMIPGVPGSREYVVGWTSCCCFASLGGIYCRCGVSEQVCQFVLCPLSGRENEESGSL